MLPVPGPESCGHREPRSSAPPDPRSHRRRSALAPRLQDVMVRVRSVVSNASDVIRIRPGQLLMHRPRSRPGQARPPRPRSPSRRPHRSARSTAGFARRLRPECRRSRRSGFEFCRQATSALRAMPASARSICANRLSAAVAPDFTARHPTFQAGFDARMRPGPIDLRNRHARASGPCDVQVAGHYTPPHLSQSANLPESATLRTTTLPCQI